MLKISNISKEFGKDNKKVQALNHINLQVDKGVVLCQDLVQIKMRKISSY